MERFRYPLGGEMEILDSQSFEKKRTLEVDSADACTSADTKSKTS